MEGIEGTERTEGMEGTSSALSKAALTPVNSQRCYDSSHLPFACQEHWTFLLLARSTGATQTTGGTERTCIPRVIDPPGTMPKTQPSAASHDSDGWPAVTTNLQIEHARPRAIQNARTPPSDCSHSLAPSRVSHETYMHHSQHCAACLYMLYMPKPAPQPSGSN
ncbi:unnamed protein product [Symbiodinium natans]|uniref:Uncharacterized protein n=1 Tax=Symbiodinium natans TaxID=878477 RepID=A0A812ID28_9DINO|nr:unnamed protein product [Symbiodinium natans]